jgi:hypothetical protein
MSKGLALFSAALLFQSQTCWAGAVPQEMYWPVSSKAVKINTAIPAGCDTPSANAAATINGIGAKFQLTGTGTWFTSTRYSATQDPDFINIEDASGMTAIMQTNFYYYDYPRPPDQAIDATIYVDTNRIYYAGTSDAQQSGDFFCSSYVPAGGIGQLIDYQSAMLHEFGHIMGMGHRTDGTTGPCVMTKYLPAGQIKRSFCSDEANLMLGFYGPR